MKRYIQNWKKIYKFEEFGDYENFFIELCYVANNRGFKSELLAPLTNKIAQNGKPIFANENIDFTKYVLLNERIEEQTNELIFVYETYGYAPNQTYVDYSSEPINRFGIIDSSGAKSSKVTNAKVLENDENVIYFDVADIDSFVIGDQVYFTRPAYRINSYPVSHVYDAITSPLVPITDKKNGKIFVPKFKFIGDIDGVYEINRDFTDPLIEPQGIYVSINKDASTKRPKAETSQIKQLISFSCEFPEIESRFIVSNGLDEVDTISDSSTPSITEWKRKIANREYYNVQDAQVEVVYPKTFFKKTLKQTLAK